MPEVIKTTTLGNGAEIKVIFHAFIENENLYADGYNIETGKSHYHEIVKVQIKVAGKTHYSAMPRTLDAENKFDAPLIKKGAFAMVGRQPVSEATYNSIVALINEAAEECLTPDLNIAKSKQKETMKKASAAFNAEQEADAEYERQKDAVYKIMDAGEDRE